MTAVLVVGNCPEIEALLAELVIFAGYQPSFTAHDETLREAAFRRRVYALLVDAALPMARLEQCEAVARERSAALVYSASTLDAGELRSFAERRGRLYFLLPNGPRLLAAVLREALTAMGQADAAAPLPPSPAFVQAMRAIARARELGAVAHRVAEENRQLRGERATLLADARESLGFLRRSVLAYSRDLRDDGLSRARAVEIVRGAIRDGAAAAGAPALALDIDGRVARWVDEAYCVA